jgi:hypothetical protein
MAPTKVCKALDLREPRNASRDDRHSDHRACPKGRAKSHTIAGLGAQGEAACKEARARTVQSIEDSKWLTAGNSG